MPKSRQLLKRRSCELLFLSLILLGSGFCLRAHAQQPLTKDSPERDQAIALYKQGDAKGAGAALRAVVKHQPEDISAWYYLGLALEQNGDKNGAKKAYEKAAKLGDSLLDKQLSQTPNGKEIGPALMLIRPQLMAAIESAEKYLALDSKLSSSKREEWSLRASSLRGFADLAGDDNLRLYSGKEVDTKARVLDKPEPIYTEAARQNQTKGTIVLRCVFGANGKVFGIRVLSSLPDGLTESAISSARHIRFIPAIKDGRPVSMWMELQYNFNVY
jgi:TonB family protein